ncbi:MAG: hypothetical protein RSE00_00700 [Clostridia bacterium]
MKKTKNIIIIIIIAMSIALIVGISIKLLDTTGTINQGNFRINDAVITSSVDVIEADEQEKTTQQESNAENKSQGLSALTLNLSQNNKIALLVTKDMEAEQIYIDNISFRAPEKKGIFTIEQKGKEEKISLDEEIQPIKINKEIIEDQYYIELLIKNQDFLKNAKIPESNKSVTYDGTVLKILDIKLAQIQFFIKFDLNIIDKTGKKNVCKFDLELPDAELLDSGISINRENAPAYVFRVKAN